MALKKLVLGESHGLRVAAERDGQACGGSRPGRGG